MFEAEAEGGGGEEEEAAESGDGGGEGGGDGGGFEAELMECAGGEAGPEDALHGVFEDVEDVGVAEEEGAGFLGSEFEVAAS